MKTQTTTKKYSMLLFSALASLMLMTAACQKNGGGSSNPAPVGPVYPGCTIQPCVGGAGQVPLYGGTANSMTGTQVQFQVIGDSTGAGMASITGGVTFNNYVCRLGQPNLAGPYTIQMTQQGYLQSDMFYGSVMLTGPQGSIPATIQVIPSRPQNTGLFRLYLTQCMDAYGYSPVLMEMNF